MWRIRSSIVIDRSAGTVSIGPCPARTRSFSTATRRLPSCGRNRSIGSASPRRPSSHSNSPATPVMGLVMEAMANSGVARHWGASVRAEMANGFVEDKAPVPGDRDDRAGELASFDLGVQRRDDPAKPRGGHADRFRLRTRQRVLVGDRPRLCLRWFRSRRSSRFSWRSFSEPRGNTVDGGAWVNPDRRRISRSGFHPEPHQRLRLWTPPSAGRLEPITFKFGISKGSRLSAPLVGVPGGDRRVRACPGEGQAKAGGGALSA